MLEFDKEAWIFCPDCIKKDSPKDEECVGFFVDDGIVLTYVYSSESPMFRTEIYEKVWYPMLFGHLKMLASKGDRSFDVPVTKENCWYLAKFVTGDSYGFDVCFNSNSVEISWRNQSNHEDANLCWNLSSVFW